MKRVPIVPTILVLIAAAAMVALGVWQLHRAEWKNSLLTRYAAAPAKPPVAWPATPPRDGSLLYRRSEAFCLQPAEWSARGGRNRGGVSGWRHIVTCRTGAEGPGIAIDMGWSNDPAAPVGWRGGKVTGTIDSDRDHILLLVSDTAAPGLQPSLRPTPEDIPNNHLAYAVQWFAFAGIAVLIYVLALRRRWTIPPPPTPQA